jgi:tellurite methyltransferase
MNLSRDLKTMFGDVDIYLFDQFLRGRFDGRQRVLDAGCGEGRNLVFLLQKGFACFGADSDPRAIDRVRGLAERLAPSLPAENFQVAPVERMPWPDAGMDAVVASALLHFARDIDHFNGMVAEMWRVLAPGGLFFARLASNIGIESDVPLAGRRVTIPDGSVRFVADERMLVDCTSRLGGRLADPIKTTNVQQERCMTTWVVEKR